MHPIAVKILTSPIFWEYAYKLAIYLVEELSKKDENDLTSNDVQKVIKAVNKERVVRAARKKAGPRH